MTGKRKQYVLGFLFTPYGNSVLLIGKNRPESQRGLLNGIGGKVEAGETPDAAMKREAFEEAGIRRAVWSPIGTISNRWLTVFCFCARQSQGEEFVTRTDEVLTYHHVADLDGQALARRPRAILPGQLHGAPAAFAGDDPVHVGLVLNGTHDQVLQQAVLGDRGGQLGQPLLVEGLARVQGGGAQLLEHQLGRARGQVIADVGRGLVAEEGRFVDRRGGIRLGVDGRRRVGGGGLGLAGQGVRLRGAGGRRRRRGSGP